MKKVIKILTFSILLTFCLHYKVLGQKVYCPKDNTTNRSARWGIEYRCGVVVANNVSEFVRNFGPYQFQYSGYPNNTYCATIPGNNEKVCIWVYFPKTGKMDYCYFDGNAGNGWFFEGSSLPNGKTSTYTFSGSDIKVWVQNPYNEYPWTSSDVLFKFYSE